MSGIASFIMGAIHCALGYVHIGTPLAAIDLIHGPGYEASDSIDSKMVAHLVSVVGAFHIFTGVLFIMLSVQDNVSIRKCIHGIHGCVLVPIMVWNLVKAPPTGTALPNYTTAMPMPLIYFWIVLDLFALIFGGKSSPKTKTN
eukprot:m.129170 g.129170  ORF g.129170 m.129170 type:complete len:143 (+) comp22312_c0_seq1:37-465(+)